MRLVEFHENTKTCEKLTYRVKQNGILFLIILPCLLSNSSKKTIL